MYPSFTCSQLRRAQEKRQSTNTLNSGGCRVNKRLMHLPSLLFCAFAACEIARPAKQKLRGPSTGANASRFCHFLSINPPFFWR